MKGLEWRYPAWIDNTAPSSHEFLNYNSIWVVWQSVLSGLQINTVIAIALGCLLELDSKTLLMNTSHTLDADIVNWILSPWQVVFIVLEDPLQAIGEEKSSEVMQLWPMHSITQEGLLDKICLLIKQWQRYSEGYQYLFIWFVARFMT